MSTAEGCDGCLGWFQQWPAQQQPQQQLPDSVKSKSAAGEATPNEIDSLFAKEMGNLSLSERERALDDLHGIRRTYDEDPASIRLCMSEMDVHLNKLKIGTAYGLAEAMSREYVSSEKFRLMFLRADGYVAKDAAEKMVRFFEKKRELFGVQKLVKDITLDDLDEELLEELKLGSVQISPLTDTAGRLIITFMHKLRRCNEPKTVMRLHYYVYMSAVESSEVQKKGLVGVWYMLDLGGIKSVTGNLRTVLPIFHSGGHFCHNSNTDFLGLSVGFRHVNTRLKVRYRRHYGSRTECTYALSTFGIPPNALPVTSDGQILTDHHLAWLKGRRQIESQRNFASQNLPMENMPLTAKSGDLVSVFPQENDVLFGRGKGIEDHPGNLRFKTAIDLFMLKYEDSNRLEKTEIAEAIVKRVGESAGRFLRKETDSEWEEVDGLVARKKVAHAFRNRRKFLNKYKRR